MSLNRFIAQGRVSIHDGAQARRQIYLSRIVRSMDGDRLDDLMADRVPLYYRSPEAIAEMLYDGYFRTAFLEAVRRLPTSTHFRESHFGEILSAVFAQEVVGWRLIYHKLRLVSSENSNPYKMDLLFFDPNRAVPTIILGEVKSSMKAESPAAHDNSCYASLFDSLRDYTEDDLQYDLTAARDHVNELPKDEQEVVRRALMPYTDGQILYAGFVVIDTNTRNERETSVLATRRSAKEFDIDLVCVDDISEVCESTYRILDRMRNV